MAETQPLKYIMAPRHSWSDDDNLIAYYLYRFGEREINATKKELAEILGMPSNSLTLKISNFKAIDGPGGLDGYSHQAVLIYKQYSGLPDDELKTAGQEAVVRAMGKRIKDLEAQQAQKNL